MRRADTRIEFEPYERWPHPETTNRTVSQFRSTLTFTLHQLQAELSHLEAYKHGAAALHVVTRNGAADVRRDGMLRAGASATHPGVSLAFGSKYGGLEVFCDRYTGRPGMPGWHANLRAIVLTLEALRAVDRYGVGGMGQQYRGWRQIEVGERAKAAARLRLITIAGCQELDYPDRQTLRLAKAKAHPDQHDGDRTLWDEVEQAARTLGIETEGGKR